MFKLKIFSLLFVFSFLLVGTSTIKNETREIERKINNINQKINLKEKDLNESQLDFFLPYISRDIRAKNKSP